MTSPSNAGTIDRACLAEIGIHNAEHRERAIAIGDALGVYRGYPVSKGCTSPFAPICIEVMVSRQGCTGKQPGGAARRRSEVWLRGPRLLSGPATAC